jgi:hypothetical protein
MWTIIKFDKKKLELLKKDFKEKLGEDFTIYKPKLAFKKYKNNKLINKEFNLLGDYLFCFHKKFEDSKVINSLVYTRGLKYFLNGFVESQSEVRSFIQKCKNSEDKNGYLCNQFYELKVNSSYQFFSGPFTNAIFKIIELQKHKINVLIGDLKTTVNKKEFLFKPI